MKLIVTHEGETLDLAEAVSTVKGLQHASNPHQVAMRQLGWAMIQHNPKGYTSLQFYTQFMSSATLFSILRLLYDLAHELVNVELIINDERKTLNGCNALLEIKNRFEDVTSIDKIENVETTRKSEQFFENCKAVSSFEELFDYDKQLRKSFSLYIPSNGNYHFGFIGSDVQTNFEISFEKQACTMLGRPVASFLSGKQRDEFESSVDTVLTQQRPCSRRLTSRYNDKTWRFTRTMIPCPNLTRNSVLSVFENVSRV